jgi:hypothetical protein
MKGIPKIDQIRYFAAFCLFNQDINSRNREKVPNGMFVEAVDSFQIRVLPSFVGTKKTGVTQGDVLVRTTPKLRSSTILLRTSSCSKAGSL